jgi:hypothetical protein
MHRKPGSIQRLEDRMQALEEGSVRFRVLDACRRFKTSWIEFGQALVAVQRDKLYREWGFLSFESYCVKELGIRQATALKLVRSYAFLESEEPRHLEPPPGGKCPDLEAVNLLRLARRNRALDEQGYGRIRREVLEEARDPAEVRREIRFLIARSSPEAAPEAARADRRTQFLRRFARTLEEARTEASLARFLPGAVLVEIGRLRARVEKELER